MGFLERLESMRFLRDVSELSGGFAMTSPAKPTERLERLVADSSRYYMLGFSPSDPPEEDELRRIERLRSPFKEDVCRELCRTLGVETAASSFDDLESGALQQLDGWQYRHVPGT